MRGENRGTPSCTSWSKIDSQQTQPTFCVAAGIKPRPHQWKKGSLSTVPVLLPFLNLIFVHVSWLSYPLLVDCEFSFCFWVTVTNLNRSFTLILSNQGKTISQTNIKSFPLVFVSIMQLFIIFIGGALCRLI